jgi:hypothetical protein
MKKVILILALAVFLCTAAGNLWAQEVKFPNVSQKASVFQTIGLTDVTITFHRPGVKGRVIWGGLVPYDKIWRTGANNATIIEFSNDVMIEGNSLPAGKYGLYTIPGQEEWTFIFSKQTDLWGDSGYKEEEDALRVKVKPAQAPDCEWMMFAFTDLSEDSAKLVLRWEKLMVGFTIKIDTQAMILKNIENTIGRYWITPYRAANFAFGKEMMDKAKEWIDMSVNIQPIYWNMFLKAKIYKKMAKTKAEEKQALALLEKAVALSKQLPEAQQDYATEAVKLLDEWKGKKK